MAKKFRQGFFVPRHPEKYRGNVEAIVYRSSWELKVNQFLDGNPNVVEWCSECITIPYLKPTDGKIHRYFPDYWVKYRTADGKTRQEILEVKPEKETRFPKGVGKRRKQQLHEQLTYAVNVAKWRHASEFCRKYGLIFRILTEKEIFKN